MQNTSMLVWEDKQINAHKNIPLKICGRVLKAFWPRRGESMCFSLSLAREESAHLKWPLLADWRELWPEEAALETGRRVSLASAARRGGGLEHCLQLPWGQYEQAVAVAAWTFYELWETSNWPRAVQSVRAHLKNAEACARLAVLWKTPLALGSGLGHPCQCCTLG